VIKQSLQTKILNIFEIISFFSDQYSLEMMPTYLAAETVILQIFRWMYLTVQWLMDGHLFGRFAQLVQLNDRVVLKTTHALVRDVTASTQECRTVAATGDGGLLVLARSACQQRRLNGGQVQNIGQNVVLRQSGHTIQSHFGRLLACWTLDNIVAVQTHRVANNIVDEQLLYTRFAEHVQTRQYPR
jgi:hypothetical protein